MGRHSLRYLAFYRELTTTSVYVITDEVNHKEVM